MSEATVAKILAIMSEAVHEGSLKHRGDQHLAGVHFDPDQGVAYGTNGREILIRIDAKVDRDVINPAVPFYSYTEEDYVRSQLVGQYCPFTTTAAIDKAIDRDYNYVVVLPVIDTMEKIRRRFRDDNSRYGIKLIGDVYEMTKPSHIFIPSAAMDPRLGYTRRPNGVWLLEHPIWGKPIIVGEYSKYNNSLDPANTVYIAEIIREDDRFRYVNVFKKLEENKVGIKFGMFDPRYAETFDPFDLDEYLACDSFFFQRMIEGVTKETYYGFQPFVLNLDLFYYCLGVFKDFSLVELHIRDNNSPICISGVRTNRQMPVIDVLLAPVEVGKVRCMPE